MHLLSFIRRSHSAFYFDKRFALRLHSRSLYLVGFVRGSLHYEVIANRLLESLSHAYLIDIRRLHHSIYGDSGFRGTIASLSEDAGNREWQYIKVLLTGKVAENRGAESNPACFVRQEGLGIQLYPYATVAIEGRRRSCN